MSNDEIQIKPDSKPLPPIKVTWLRTDIPETKVRLPIDATVTIDSGLIFRCERRGSVGADEEFSWVCDRADIQEVFIYLMPDVPDDADWSWVSENDLSLAIVRASDPYEIVPYFDHIFSTDKSYYLRALDKGLRRIGIPVTLEEETPATRKLRHIKSSMGE